MGDAGVYTCRSVNKESSVEAFATLTVTPTAPSAPSAASAASRSQRRPPVFVRRPEALEAASGATVEFTCLVSDFKSFFFTNFCPQSWNSTHHSLSWCCPSHNDLSK